MTVVVREAVPAEYEAIGALTVAAYAIFAEADDDGTYMAELRDAGGSVRAGHAAGPAAGPVPEA